jgi:regulator of replication initiation timing
MKSNVLLKWLVIPMLVLVVIIFVKSSPRQTGTASNDTSRLTPEEMAALGIEGDTPRDTVATLVAQVKQLRNELQTQLRDNQNQKAENNRLREREAGVEQRIQSALDAEKTRLAAEQEKLAADRQQTQGLLQRLEARLDEVKGKPDADLPVGFGLDDVSINTRSAETRWIEPEGKAFVKAALASSGQNTLSLPDSLTALPVIEAVKPVYTIPENATLIGSIAMTALIGRVPVDGTVNDPYPFKVVIGPDNLAANGIALPDVAGAVASGIASGDWTLSCVRGEIRSFTFVFQDGTIRTLPESGGKGGGSSKQKLGWISDDSGVPCISGERKSNAAQYLGTQSLMTAAGAGAASLIKSDDGRITVVSNSDAVGTVGISASDAMGRILANGVQDMSQWVNKLYGQTFAAIYVRPGARVAIHIDEALPIDFDIKGRKLKHDTGGAHETKLD